LQGHLLLTSLSKRTYLKLAIFWGLYYPDQLTPENASQHGRFYPATGSDPAVVIVTDPDMRPIAHPIPTALEQFVAAWTLNPADLATIKKLGFPGL
jgi:hypothetical protein